MQALAGLVNGWIVCGNPAGKGRLADLSPLKDMKLTGLSASNRTKVSDRVSLLKGMPLTGAWSWWRHVQGGGGGGVRPVAAEGHAADCPATAETRTVSDLSPLERHEADVAVLAATTPVADLSPPKDTKLSILYCGETTVLDLSPPKDMKLTTLWCENTSVLDLSPPKGMQLKDLALVRKRGGGGG